MSRSDEEGKPSVCLVVNGGREVLELAAHALEQNTPTIAVKGSGGIADVLANLVESRSDNQKDGKKLCKDAMQEKIHLTEDKDVKMMETIYSGFIDRVVIYDPVNERNSGLVRPVLDALLKSKKFQQARSYLETLQTIHKRRENEETVSQYPCFIQSPDGIIGLLLNSLIDHSSSASAVIIRSLDIPFDTINFDRLKELCKKSPEHSRSNNKEKARIFDGFLCQIVRSCRGKSSLEDASNATNVTDTENDDGEKRYQKLRADLEKYTSHLMETPLHRCKKEADICKHFSPTQELFLWSLLFGDPELSDALLEHVENKMAACLFAFAVCTGMANKETQHAKEQELRQKASHFEDLACICLRNCYQEEKDRAEELLCNKMYKWGNFSLLQMGIVTESMAFIAEDATKAHLDMIWNGQIGFVSGEFTCRDHVFKVFTPWVTYGLELILQLLFLSMFSFWLLFDYQTTPSWRYMLLAIYVADEAFDEIRQTLTGTASLASGQTCNPKVIKSYIFEKWNFVDLISILLFALGTLVFVDNEIAFIVGRIALSLDALVFFLRFLRLMLYFEGLGIFLVMAKKSLIDTVYFMLILLTVLWGFLVSSHGMLFTPASMANMTWDYIMDLPFKGYWQAFNPDMESISVCQEWKTRELEYGECKTESLLATQYGHYISSVLMALYLMFVNVLLVNLLIAKFNHTFTQVYEKAKQHQSWQSCQLVQEIYVHIPAPFNIVMSIFLPISTLITAILCCGFALCLCKDASEENTEDHERPNNSKDDDDIPSGDPSGMEMFEAEQMEKALMQSGTGLRAESAEDLTLRVAHLQRKLNLIDDKVDQLLTSMKSNTRTPSQPTAPRRQHLR